MKLNLCGVFLLCCSSVGVLGQRGYKSESNETQTQNSNSKCLFKCEDFKALETTNLELAKDHAELMDQVKSLIEKFDELKNEISLEHGVWLLTPPLIELPEQQEELESTEEHGPSEPWLITSCTDAMEIMPPPLSQKQTICPHGNGNRMSLEVLCDFETDGGGWTIIQKRSTGPRHEFNQTWSKYKNGFGSLDNNFWIGLENIHALTKNGDQELRIELEDFEGEKKYAKYSSFSVSDASDFYRLSLSGFSASSTAGDSMINPDLGSGNFLSGMRFTTKDKDNDLRTSGNCAVNEGGGGGWWYKSGCTYSNLNGGYFEKGETSSCKGILWNSWRGYYYSLAKSEIKIRTRK